MEKLPLHQKANLDKSADSIQRINKTSWLLKYSNIYFDFFLYHG